MRQRIKEAIGQSVSLDEVKEKLISEIDKISKETGQRWHYVSGIITSEGPARVHDNLQILARYTKDISTEVGVPTLSATEVFDDQLFKQINADQIPYNDWLDFWQGVLSCGAFQTIHMTPRWNISVGCIDEYDTARDLGLEIIYRQ